MKNKMVNIYQEKHFKWRLLYFTL